VNSICKHLFLIRIVYLLLNDHCIGMVSTR